MANRNVSQLPENTAPEDTDWLLGASGNSPSVFQKVAVGNLPGSAPSTGGSIKFALPINQNYTLTSSGYYFTDAIASDIEINCSNLGIGDHVYWLNLSTKSIVFSGLNSIDSVSILANKGVKIASTNFIEFFLKDINKNIKKLSGSHFIDWLPGVIPPYIEFIFDSHGDTNGMVYYLGALKHGSSFINPSQRGELTLSSSSNFNSANIPLLTMDRNTNNYWISGGGGGQWLRWYFNNNQSAEITAFTVRGEYALGVTHLQGSEDGTNWSILGTFNIGSGNYYSGVFTNTVPYSYYRLFMTTAPVGNIFINELEFYGKLYSSST